MGSGLSWGIRSRLADQDSRDIAPLMQHLQPVQTANLFITRALCLEPRIQSGSGERKGDSGGAHRNDQTSASSLNNLLIAHTDLRNKMTSLVLTVNTVNSRRFQGTSLC